MAVEPLRAGAIPLSARAPGASILIPVRDKLPLTRACLAALRAQDLPAEIIVVDDGSEPEAAAALDAFANEVTVVRHERSRGFAAACNTAARAATGRAIVLLNNDTLPLEGWLAALQRYADAHPAAAIVGARLLYPDRTVQHVGVTVDAEGSPRHLYAGLPGDHPAARRSRQVQMATGAALLVRREVWDALGGLDTTFTNGYEDLDLCLRARAAGHEVHVCGEATLLHLESATRTRVPAGELENLRRFRERWGRLPTDDLHHYADDGLVRAEAAWGGMRVFVAPELGRAMGGPDLEVDRLLERRSAEVYRLREENIILRAGLADPWRGLQAPAARTATDPEATIVVPLSGHGRVPELLEALRGQSGSTESFEVIVVNPGTPVDAATGAALDAAAPLRLRALDVDASGGRAAAWNRGIAEANGGVVILLADDFIPGRDFVESHLSVHRGDPRVETVAVGPARFPDGLRASSPFVRWLEDSGTLFGVPFTRLAGELPDGYFFGGNASIRRDFVVQAGPFDERFSEYAGDDHDLGRRLHARGMVVRYVPRALAIHDHDVSLSERREALRAAGRAAAIADRTYAPPHAWHSGTDPSAGPSAPATAWAWLVQRVRGRDADRERYYERTLRRAFLAGYAGYTE